MSANCAAAAAAAARRCRRLRPSSSPLSAASAAATAAAMSGDSDRCRCCCCCWGGGFTTATSSSSSSSLSDRVMGVSCSKGGQRCDTNAKQQRVSCSHSKGGGSVARVQSSRGGVLSQGRGEGVCKRDLCKQKRNSSQLSIQGNTGQPSCLPLSSTVSACRLSLPFTPPPEMNQHTTADDLTTPSRALCKFCLCAAPCCPPSQHHGHHAC